jgi:putative nucleotidyltransferase with HDIG domain
MTDNFDTLAKTAAISDALGRLRTLAGADSGMERHCLRVRHIAARIAADRSWSVDAEVLTVAAILHDIGLYDASSKGVYTADGALLAREMLGNHGWPQERVELCANAIERHHELRVQLTYGAEVEALRLADRVDVSGGLISAGVDRDWLRALQAEIPRSGLMKDLAKLIGRMVRKRPGSLLGIFRRPS